MFLEGFDPYDLAPDPSPVLSSPQTHAILLLKNENTTKRKQTPVNHSLGPYGHRPRRGQAFTAAYFEKNEKITAMLLAPGQGFAIADTHFEHHIIVAQSNRTDEAPHRSSAAYPLANPDFPATKMLHAKPNCGTGIILLLMPAPVLPSPRALQPKRDPRNLRGNLGEDMGDLRMRTRGCEGCCRRKKTNTPLRPALSSPTRGYYENDKIVGLRDRSVITHSWGWILLELHILVRKEII